MKILGLESSATSASVAVVENGKVIALTSSNTGLTHSQTLMPMVENTLKKADVTINDIDYLAISNGPGSFTGVRIGVSAVKGICDPLNKKCVGISTLEAIAKPLENTGVIAVATMDARCNQVYTATFDCLNGEMKRLTEDEAITIDELTERLKTQEKQVVLIGDGANICYNKMKDVLKDVAAEIDLDVDSINFIEHDDHALFIGSKFLEYRQGCFPLIIYIIGGHIKNQ